MKKVISIILGIFVEKLLDRIVAGKEVNNGSK